MNASLDCLGAGDLDTDEDEAEAGDHHLELLEEEEETDAETEAAFGPGPALTEEVLASYRANGWVLFERAVTPDALRELTLSADAVRDAAEAEAAVAGATSEEPPRPVAYERLGSGERVCCRVEGFANELPEARPWAMLGRSWLRRAAARLLGAREGAVMFKEKVNFKHAGGGGGYAPHTDGASAAAHGCGATEFITAMVAVTDHGVPGCGCMQMATGAHVAAVDMRPADAKSGDPDRGGRVGALTAEAAAALSFEPVACPAGSVLFFHGDLPHRSAQNTTADHCRTAAFLLFNPRRQGDRRAQYFARMRALRVAAAEKRARDRRRHELRQLQLEAQRHQQQREAAERAMLVGAVQAP